MLNNSSNIASLANKKVILGLTGGIAAYKSAELCRQLIRVGATVKVVMTEGAQAFITPLTLQALSGNRVYTSLLDAEAEAAMGHIELARWADLVLIAPASASAMARLAGGEANDLLTTLTLATQAPIAIAPAMNQAMWADERSQKNLEKLISIGFHIFGPDSGDQACGDVGMGRMQEPERLTEQAAGLFETGLLAGLHICITAGPTREAIDPVRFISNHSSGKMGYAIAQAAIDAGAKVTLISGPVALTAPELADTIQVDSASDMLNVCQTIQSDIFIGVAAVADFKPEVSADYKLKKQPDQNEMTIRLVKNPDILATIASSESAPFCVGFAAETDNINEYAKAKLARKNLGLIFANNATDTFNSDDAAITAFWPTGEEAFEQASKSQLATNLVALISRQFHASRS